MDLGKKLIMSNPSIGIVGPDLKNIPRYDDILNYTISTRDKAIEKASKKSFF
jgi:hypothetical protein